MRPDFPPFPRLCDTSHMAEIFDMASVRIAIQRQMDLKGIKKKPLAKAAGLGETAIRDIFDAERKDVKTSTLVKLAEFFEVPVDSLAGREEVDLVGKVGAGGSVLFEAFDVPETVPRPPAAAGKLVALVVEGESMLPRYDPGDIIYIKREHDGVLPEYIGHYCAVHLSDGGTFLKILELGTEPGVYTLRSHNAADMRNVEVIWASPVLFVMPRRVLPAPQ